MAHHTTIQAYAKAAHDEYELMKQLAAVRSELTKWRPQVLEHVRREPVSCVVGDGVLVTLEPCPHASAALRAIVSRVSV